MYSPNIFFLCSLSLKQYLKIDYFPYSSFQNLSFDHLIYCYFQLYCNIWEHINTKFFSLFICYFDSNTLQEYDYFQKQKDASLLDSLKSISSVLEHVHDFTDTTDHGLEQFFGKILRVSIFCVPFFLLDTYTNKY